MCWCRFQKVSLYSWAGGSVCTAINEAFELLRISKIKRKGETDSEWALRRAKAVGEVNGRLLTLFHSLVQVGLAEHHTTPKIAIRHVAETLQWKKAGTGWPQTLWNALGRWQSLPQRGARMDVTAGPASCSFQMHQNLLRAAILAADCAGRRPAELVRMEAPHSRVHWCCCIRYQLLYTLSTSSRNQQEPFQVIAWKLSQRAWDHSWAKIGTQESMILGKLNSEVTFCLAILFLPGKSEMAWCMIIIESALENHICIYKNSTC